MNKYLALILTWTIVSGIGIYQRTAEGAVLQGFTLQAPNASGGQIVLTARECPGGAKDARWAYTFNGTDGTLQEGCWRILDSWVEVTWGGNVKKVYAPAQFKSINTVTTK